MERILHKPSHQIKRNGSDNESGYNFILHDVATISNLTPVIVSKKEDLKRKMFVDEVVLMRVFSKQYDEWIIS